MDRTTVRVYDEHGALWAANRTPVRRRAARRFAQRLGRDAIRIDLGAGAGRYTSELGRPVIALDASMTMLRLLREAAPDALPLLADLERLPFRDRGLRGAWANMSYLHIPRPRLPLALAQLHWAMAVDAPYDLQVLRGDRDLGPLADDDVPGRRFAAWSETALKDTLVGAGFSVDDLETERDVVRASGARLLSLPDIVGPGMRLLVCGLNPSIYSAERGVAFARRANRFWSCAVEAGLATVAFDPRRALADGAMGLTDLVKRPTVRSSELRVDEYRAGLTRVKRVVERFEPAVVCFVGLEGWRAAVDRRATAGVQPDPIAGATVYVMPSTSGLNASSSRADLVKHMRRVRRLAGIS